MSYEIGDIARLKVTFTDITGALADPTTITVTVQFPDGTQTIYPLPPIVRSSIGLYYYDLTITQAGEHFYKWTGTGAIMAVGEGSIQVDASTLIPQPPGIGSPGFTYSYGNNVPLDYVRILIPDTDSTKPIFADAEILMFLQMESSQALYVSPQSNPTAFPTSSVYIPQIYSPLLAAALALDSLAGNKARLSSVIQLLDVKLDPAKAAIALHAQAESYRQREQDQGHFAIAEQVVNQFTARERVWAQWLRLYAN